MNREEFKKDEIIQHFKRELITQKELMDSDYDIYKYLYTFVGDGIDTETNEPVCIYQSLSNGQLYVRPKDMFYGKVDKEKYPDVKQEYRLERYNKNEDKYVLLRWNDEELDISVAAGVMPLVMIQKTMKDIVIQKVVELTGRPQEKAEESYYRALTSNESTWLSVYDLGASIIYGSEHEERYQIVKWSDYNL